MKGNSCRPTLAAGLLLAVLFLASCAKEEPVAPASFTAQGAVKSTATTDEEKPDAVLTKGGNGGSTGEGSGISDDGDDISGTERKRRPGS